MALILFKTLVIICGLQLLRYANVLEEKEQLLEQNRRGRDYLKHFGTVQQEPSFDITATSQRYELMRRQDVTSQRWCWLGCLECPEVPTPWLVHGNGDRTSRRSVCLCFCSAVAFGTSRWLRCHLEHSARRHSFSSQVCTREKGTVLMQPCFLL